MIPTGNPPELSLIFVNYRSAHALSRSIRSVSSDLDSGFAEGIVVNNDLNEEEVVRKLCDRFGLRMVRMAGNSGFGAASNRGAELARADILGFVNPDTELIRGSLRDIVRFFRLEKGVGIVGVALVDRFGVSERWSVGATASLFTMIINNFGIRSGMPRKAKYPYRTGFVSGAAMFVEKSLFSALGGFDERFFLYFEDMDLCVRARAAGASVISVPSPVFRHLSGQSHKSSESMKREFYKSQDLYFGKHRPAWESSVLKFLRNRFVG